MSIAKIVLRLDQHDVILKEIRKDVKETNVDLRNEIKEMSRGIAEVSEQLAVITAFQKTLFKQVGMG